MSELHRPQTRAGPRLKNHHPGQRFKNPKLKHVVSQSCNLTICFQLLVDGTQSQSYALLLPSIQIYKAWLKLYCHQYVRASPSKSGSNRSNFPKPSQRKLRDGCRRCLLELPAPHCGRASKWGLELRERRERARERCPPQELRTCLPLGSMHAVFMHGSRKGHCKSGLEYVLFVSFQRNAHFPAAREIFRSPLDGHRKLKVASRLNETLTFRRPAKSSGPL